ncbi:SPX domain-containing protein [Besnoitia besnoiti]|uniref:SPX domain-containing protein n=1 Tax=Besnoitia besnoiti TaxID=94643 RepID=A0A2A9MNL4_BESBE|nr:SPX domain-containing protein [Besnoitia besnoiti]PFH38151.1 SPX domain-containing protein [Besnoitia besnoiti]
MKFGAKLVAYAVPEWRASYINYGALKKLIKQCQTDVEAAGAVEERERAKRRRKLREVPDRESKLRQPTQPGDPPTVPPLSSDAPSAASPGPPALSGEQGRGPALGSASQPLLREGRSEAAHRADGLEAAAEDTRARGPIESARQTGLRAFDALLESEVAKVESHFNEEIIFLVDRLMAIEEELLQVETTKKRGTALRGGGASGAATDETADAKGGRDPREPCGDGVQDSAHEGGSGGDGRADEAEDRWITPEEEGEEGGSPEAVVATEAEARLARVLPGTQAAQDEVAEKEARTAYLRRLERMVLSILDTLEKLEGFAKLNTVCVYKILKKRDKKLKTRLMQAAFETYQKRLNSLVVPPRIKSKILDLYRRLSRAAGDKEETREALTFHQLQMSVQKDMLARRGGIFGFRDKLLYFSMGCMVILFLNILVLSLAPSSNPRFKHQTLLAYLPIYRFVFLCAFGTMASAAAIATMEHFGVNYKFLLDINPKCQVDSTTLFGIAALQQFLFLLTFTAFLLDYKFAVLGNHNFYWLYTLVAILLQLGLLVLPHPTFRLTYRRQILGTLKQVLLAGVFAVSDVTLAQNIVGDVLTSFSKPLNDLHYILCYYATGVSYDTKPQCAGDAVLRPMMGGLPFVLRFCQCLIRYRGSKNDVKARRMHLLNAAKYVSGLLVIFCNSVPWQALGVSPYSVCLIWVCSYLLGTIYMFAWDMKVDWGLMPDPDHFIRTGGSLMYPRWVYRSIAMGNLVGRLTWAMTLMPSTFDSVRGNLLILLISLIEICRRAAWTVLRLEHEHLSNSSKFRAMLWVPPLYHDPSLLLFAGQRGNGRKGKGEERLRKPSSVLFS